MLSNLEMLKYFKNHVDVLTYSGSSDTINCFSQKNIDTAEY